VFSRFYQILIYINNMSDQDENTTANPVEETGANPVEETEIPAEETAATE
jgi:hypothetical protein